jgi:hypothetical protein
MELEFEPSLGYTHNEDQTTNELTPFEKDMINRFRHHPPRDEQSKHAHETMRNQCLKMSSFINSYVPPGREQALALTKLEELMFWANAGIARSNVD